MKLFYTNTFSSGKPISSTNFFMTASRWSPVTSWSAMEEPPAGAGAGDVAVGTGGGAGAGAGAGAASGFGAAGLGFGAGAAAADGFFWKKEKRKATISEKISDAWDTIWNFFK